MNETSAKKELPACPVETTLTLIGDKWKVLILRDAGNKAVRRTEKVRRQCVSEGLDRPAPDNGGKRTCKPQGLRRSTAESGVFSDGTRKKSETHSGFHAGMGRSI